MLPRVVMHNEMSVDGRIDWFAVSMGLYYELAGRWPVDVTLTGADTILAAMPPDAPDEAGMAPPGPDPEDVRQLLAVTDSRGRVRCWNQLRQQPYWRDAIALCSQATPETYLDYLRERHVGCIVAGDDRVDLRAALEALNARYGAELVRVDSGGALNGALLRAGLVDEVSVLVNPSLVGGTTPRSIYRAPDLTSEEGVIQLRPTGVETFDEGQVWLRYEVVR